MTSKEIEQEYGSSVSRYERLKTKRSHLEPTWRDCSQLTLPYVFPEEQNNGTELFDAPYNSIGPASVNNLASKLLMALLPASGNFFRLLPTEDVVSKMEPADVQELDKDLGKLEKGINTLIITKINKKIPTERNKISIILKVLNMKKLNRFFFSIK